MHSWLHVWSCCALVRCTHWRRRTMSSLNNILAIVYAKTGEYVISRFQYETYSGVPHFGVGYIGNDQAVPCVCNPSVAGACSHCCCICVIDSVCHWSRCIIHQCLVDRDYQQEYTTRNIMCVEYRIYLFICSSTLYRQYSCTCGLVSVSSA
jgi:hypothetical protein